MQCWSSVIQRIIHHILNSYIQFATFSLSLTPLNQEYHHFQKFLPLCNHSNIFLSKNLKQDILRQEREYVMSWTCMVRVDRIKFYNMNDSFSKSKLFFVYSSFYSWVFINNVFDELYSLFKLFWFSKWVWKKFKNW